MNDTGSTKSSGRFRKWVFWLCLAPIIFLFISTVLLILYDGLQSSLSYTALEYIGMGLAVTSFFNYYTIVADIVLAAISYVKKLDKIFLGRVTFLLAADIIVEIAGFALIVHAVGNARA